MTRGWEWQNQVPIFVFNADVFAAFDNMRPRTITKALQAAQLHPRLVAALLQETIGLQCAPEFAGVTLEEQVPFTKCARQGAAESAFEWNTIMFMCLADLVPLWHDSGYGIQLHCLQFAPVAIFLDFSTIFLHRLYLGACGHTHAFICKFTTIVCTRVSA